jgi:hypothetical protein
MVRLMKTLVGYVLVILVALSAGPWTVAQAQTSAQVVPTQIPFSGKAADDNGKTLSGTIGITFAIYSEQSGGPALWLETQNVQADNRGNYTVQMGSTKPAGLPLDLFTSGAARWLGLTVNGGQEQPRIFLLSVPYALKAADAETLGGLPASAFMLASPTVVSASSASMATSSSTPAAPAVSGTGTTDYVPLWTNSSGALGNSVLFQSGTGSAAKIGINTATPAATLDVGGSENVHGTLNLPSAGPATATTGKTSQALNFTASSYSSSSKVAIAQKFEWLAEPLSNNTSSPSGALSLLYGSGSSTPVDTGLKLGTNGRITFASGQTFPGTGSVTSVGLSAPTSDFTVSSSPVTNSGTLGLTWNVAPTSANTANAIVKRDAFGDFIAGGITANGSIAADSGVYGYGSGVGVSGQSSGTTIGSNGVQGVTYSSPSSGVAGFNYGSGGGIGVFGSGGSGSTSYGVFGAGNIGVWGTGTYGFATDSNVQQTRTANGWVKAIAVVEGYTAPYTITSCFNSTLAGAAATTPPCGFNLTEDQFEQSTFFVDFGFQVNDRFLMTSPQAVDNPCTMQTQITTSNSTMWFACWSGGLLTPTYQPYVATIMVF